MTGRVRIVLQARTTSRRLPAKVLLPVGGLPLAILCAVRLASTGREVVLATSGEPTDDVLAETARRHGVQVVRGSLDDVLSRFLACIDDLADDDLVVRATADNPLPDGAFVDELVRRFASGARRYLGTSSPADGLPYGVSAEVFRVDALRAVAGASVDCADREHVTASLRRQAGADGIVGRDAFVRGDFSALRATIDTLDDYLAMARAFAALDQPTTRGWKDFLPALPSAERGTTSGSVAPGSPRPTFMLGTAQLGSDYGVANRTGRPDDAAAAEIVALALRSGITHFDTARAYGDAEARLGKLLASAAGAAATIITKLAPLDALPDDAPRREVRTAVDAGVYGSCRDLRRRCLDIVMFHRSADLHRWAGTALARLDELRGQGVLGAIGVSVYSPEEAVACIADARITHLQIPFNLLDSRWLAADFVGALQRRADVRVHARSVFLQGLLINDADCWPGWFAKRNDFVDRLKSLVPATGRKNTADLCLAYARSSPWLTSLVLGVETSRQLEELIALFAEPTLAEDEVRLVRSRFVDVPQRLLVPSQW